MPAWLRRIWTVRGLRWGLLAVGLVTVGYLAMRPREVPVDAAPVTLGPLRVTVGNEGITSVRDRYLVVAPVAGRLERSGLRAGDSIAAGQVVARLFPLPLDVRGRQQAEAGLEAALDQQRVAAAALEQARVTLRQATSDRSRAERLLGGGGIAVADLERLQLAEAARRREVESADFRVQAAGHNAQVARAALASAWPEGGRHALELRAPVAGIVLMAGERSARIVSAGETLVALGDPAALEVTVDLLSTDAVLVTPGASMLVTGWGGEDTLKARVRRVEPSGYTKVSALGVEEQRVDVVGDFDSPPARLGDRYRVFVLVVVWEGDQVLQVPASALFRQEGGWATYVIEGGRARLRMVGIGHQSSHAAEILGGLGEGSRVVRHPTDRIADGVPVRITQR